jgi:cysteine desulfurase / selenocysteine lyase
VAGFLGAGQPEEIVFVRGATEAINLVAGSWGREHIHPGDEIVLTTLEHHSNIVPWQLLAKEKRARLRVVPIDERGAVDQEEYRVALSNRTQLVALSHVSNVLGTVLPVREMIALAHRYGARVLVDGARAVGHFEAGRGTSSRWSAPRTRLRRAGAAPTGDHGDGPRWHGPSRPRPAARECP